MKKRISALILGMAMLLSICPTGYAEQEVIEIHVSEEGKSTGNGTIKNPVDSLEAARKLVRTKKGTNPDVPINVIFHGGTYRFDQRVTFDTGDSGTEKGPITYMAASGEKVYFKGSKVVDMTKMKLVEDAQTLARLPQSSRGKVGYIDLNEQGFKNLGKIPDGRSMYYTEQSFEGAEIYLDDKQQTMARWPNGKEGYTTMAGVVSKGGTGTKGVGGTFKTHDYRLANWTTAKDAWIVGFLNYDWSYDRVPVGNIDAYSKEITLKYGTSYGLSMSHSYRWAIINLLEELDIPGEWYIDHEKNYLYYYPERNLKNSVMEVTTLEDDLIRMNDTDYINFKGITFAQTRGCAFRFYDKTEHMTISDCVFENIGRYGIWHFTNKQSSVAANTTQASQYRENGFEDVHIENNVFQYIGVSAFTIYCGSRDANIPSGCTVRNNYFSNIGEVDRVGYSASIYGVGADVSRNTIHETGYGFNYVGSDIEISSNEIYNVMKHLNDGSAIYTGRNFINRGDKIYNNYIHDVLAKDDMIKTKYAHGIYLDDHDAGTEIYDNIVVSSNTGVCINCGMSNSIHDNVFVNNAEGAVWIGVYGMGVEANYERAKKQGENALLLPGYARFPDIKADLDTDRMSYPVRNTIVNNVAYGGHFNYGEDMVNENTIEKNTEITEKDFIDFENGDYRLTEEAKKKYNTNAPGEEFDYKQVGADFAKFEKNPLENTEFKLIYPQNGAKSLTDKEITFTWQQCSPADKYHIVIATDRELKNIVHEADTYERIYTTDVLERGKIYYWKVYAENESVVGGNWESAGVAYAFSISENSVSDVNDIKVSLSAAKQKLDTIKEGDGVGFYKPGTKDILVAEIEKAEKLLNNTKATDDEKRAVVSNIEDIIDGDNFINGGYVNLGDFFGDTEHWKMSLPEGVTLTEEGLEIYSPEKSVVVAYDGFHDASRILSLKFKMKVDFNANESNYNGKWMSMGLRAKNMTSLCYDSGNDNYFMLMKEGQLEYQRNSGGSNKLLEAVKREDVKSGEWMDIDFGVVNLGGVGQLTILKINGEVAYQAVDSSEQAVMNKGAFQLNAMKDVRVTIKPADEFNETIDELITKYTFSMTEDFCKELEGYNGLDTVIVTTGSKKAFYGNKLGDIEEPLSGMGESMRISLNTAAKVFGGSVSGNVLTVGDKRLEFSADSAKVKVNGVTQTMKGTAKKENNGLSVILTDLTNAMGKRTYNQANEMYLISDSFEMHTANYGELLNSTLQAMKLYLEEK